MKRILAVMMILLAAPVAMRAEARWCASELAKASDPIYPPIAKAAHVQGIVIVRVIFNLAGSVISTNLISGPRLLAVPTMNRIADWKFSTQVSGEQPCQAIVVVSYGLEGENPPPPFQGPAGKDIFRITVLAEHLVFDSSCCVDPIGRPVLSSWLLFHRPIRWVRDAWWLMKAPK